MLSYKNLHKNYKYSVNNVKPFHRKQKANILYIRFTLEVVCQSVKNFPMRLTVPVKTTELNSCISSKFCGTNFCEKLF